MAKEVFDCIIIGSGPAGITASIYAIRANLKILLIAGSNPGGQLMITTDVDDYPGFPGGIQGPELMSRMRKHAELLGVKFLDENVSSVDFKKSPYKIFVDKKVFETKSVIVATGASAKWLGLDSEKKLVGHGVSACATCVVPDTDIITNPDIKKIKNITNDKILTHEGRFKLCHTKGTREFDGDLIVINPSFLPGKLKLTQEHEVLAAKRIKRYYYKKFKFLNKNKENWKYLMKQEGITPEWIPAGELNKGDFLFYPILKTIKDKQEIYISDFVDCDILGVYAVTKKVTHSSHKIINKIIVNEDFMRLCGYYISEGCGGKELKISFHKDELDYIEDVKKLIKKIFNMDVNIKTEDNCTSVYVYSKIIGNLFKNLFGDDATTKRLADWVLYLPHNKQKEIFKGMWRGDGSKKIKSWHYTTSSKILASHLQILLLRLEILPVISITTKERMNKKSHKINGREIIAKTDKYEFEVKGPYLQDLSEILAVDHEFLHIRKRTSTYGWFNEGYAIIPIRQTSKEYYKGLLYNLAVNEDNSYTTQNACVHNCDGFFFRNKDVAVIGGGDTALREALFLSKICKSVTIIHRRDSLRAQKVLQNNSFNTKNIKFIWNSEVKEFIGKDRLEKIKLFDSKTKKLSELKLDGAFVAIGHTPNTSFLKGNIDLDSHGYIVVKDNVKTSVGGVFAAGDVHDYRYQQAVTAAGAGCMAALEVSEYLDSLKNKK